jgi:adenylate cyclase
MPESQEATSLQLDAAYWTLGFGWRLGLGDAEARVILAEGRELAIRSGDLRARVLLLIEFASVRIVNGDPLGVQDVLEEAFGLAEQTDDAELRYAICEPMIDMLFFTGRVAAAARLCDEAIQVGRAHLDPATMVRSGIPVAWLFGYRAWIRTQLGRLDEAAASLREFEEASRGLRHTEVQSWAQTVWAIYQTAVGDARGALAHARRAVEAAEKFGSNLSRIFAHEHLGVALSLDEDWLAAVEQLELALRTARETGSWLTVEAEILAHLARARLGAGDAEGAQRTAEEAIETGRRRKTPVFEAQAHLVLARALLSRYGAKARDEIERALGSCLLLVEQTEARVQEPHARELHAELMGLLGDEAAAAGELREAQRLFAEMGATAHAERVARDPRLRAS